MLPKKSDSANLEKQRSAYFQLGLLIALSLSLIAFEWVSPVLEQIEFKRKLTAVEEPYVLHEIIAKQDEQPAKSKQPKSTQPVVPNDYTTTNKNEPETKQDFPDLTFLDEPTSGPVIEQLPLTPFEPWQLDKHPEFPGGEDALRKYIQKRIIYPYKAVSNETEGVVWVTFIIDENGNILDAKIVKDIGNGCGEEALRIVKSLPKWSPAVINGRAVPSLRRLDIRFILR